MQRFIRRKLLRGSAAEERLDADMIELSCQYGRYDYRRITALLRDADRHVSDKRAGRLWRPIFRCFRRDLYVDQIRSHRLVQCLAAYDFCQVAQFQG